MLMGLLPLAHAAPEPNSAGQAMGIAQPAQAAGAAAPVDTSAQAQAVDSPSMGAQPVATVNASPGAAAPLRRCVIVS